MADLKKKQPDEEVAVVSQDPPEAPKPASEEQFPVPFEIASAQDGIRIVIEGDRATLTLSQYMAEHIGQFRTCDRVVCVFKEGSPPDITAIHSRDK